MSIAQRFRALCISGQGTFGTVFTARDSQRDDAFVALKKYRAAEDGDNAEGLAVDVVREVNCLRACRSSPAALQLHEVIVDGHDVYLILCGMRCNLRQELRRHGSFDYERTTATMQQLSAGVAWVHSIGFMHRDMKPQNCLVDEDGSVKIGDYGTAQIIRAGRCNTTGMTTAWYSAPELLLGSTAYDGRVDVWALGCMHAELRLGGALFDGDGSEYDQLRRIFQRFGTPAADSWAHEMPAWGGGAQFPSFGARASAVLHDGDGAEERVLAAQLAPNPANRARAEEVHQAYALNARCGGTWAAVVAAAPMPVPVSFPLGAPIDAWPPAQLDIDSRMRTIVVAWMLELTTQLRFSLFSFHLAISILDAHLLRAPVLRTRLQLAGLAALVLAVKIEEGNAITIRAASMADMCAGAYNALELLAYEQQLVCEMAAFSLFPEAMLYHRLAAKLGDGDAPQRTEVLYLCTLALHDFHYASFALHELTETVWRMAHAVETVDDGAHRQFVIDPHHPCSCFIADAHARTRRCESLGRGLDVAFKVRARFAIALD